MSLDRLTWYEVAGLAGAWRFVGQATYLDDEGREVEHDHVRLVNASGDEEWVDPAEVVGVHVGNRGGVFVLGDGQVSA